MPRTVFGTFSLVIVVQCKGAGDQHADRRGAPTFRTACHVCASVRLW